MPVTSWTYVGLGYHDPDSYANWANARNIEADDTSYASAALGTGTGYSDILRGTWFGFDIPSGSVIDGIEVAIEKTRSGGSGIYDLVVRLRGALGSTVVTKPMEISVSERA